MPSFDIVCEANMVEVKNALDQANKEIGNRFDFKGTDARVEQKERELTAFADSDFQLEQVRDVLANKMSKRGVDVRFLDTGDVEKIGGDKVKQVIKVRNGIEQERRCWACRRNPCSWWTHCATNLPRRDSAWSCA